MSNAKCQEGSPSTGRKATGLSGNKRWRALMVFFSLGFALVGIVFFVAGHHWGPGLLGIGSTLFVFVLGMLFQGGRDDQKQKLLTELELANSRLTALNKEKNEFLGIAAHDLKNPLTLMMGYSELLCFEDVPADRTKHLAQSILREARRMRRLISDLLDLNAIEEGRMNLKIEPVRLLPALDNLLQSYTGIAARKLIAFQADVDPTIIAMVDEKALVQIHDNLLSNAIKFTMPKGVVSLSAWQDGKSVWIRVSDTGPGFSLEDQAKLFGRFARLTAQPTGGESSNGLGLSIVKRLVDAMNAEIRVESELGKGTSFVLRFSNGLPVSRTEPAALTVDARDTIAVIRPALQLQS